MSEQLSATERLPGTRFLIDVHCHGGVPAGMIELSKEVNSPEDWGLIRSKDPKRFAKAMGEEQVDNSHILVDKMDEKGVTHALLQMTPGKGSTNKSISDMAQRHEGRFFPIYRPEFMMGAVGAGDMTKDPDKEVFFKNSEHFVEDIESLFPELGMIGVGEVIPGGMVTSAVDPVEIARAMSPIMEALSGKNLPIMFPTGYTGWQGGLHYIWNPIWVDELAGLFPDVPIVLAKIGRGFRTPFDTCMVVATRNANVYVEMTDVPSNLVREAIELIGAQRIMFGVDLSQVSLNYAYELGFHNLNGAEPMRKSWSGSPGVPRMRFISLVWSRATSIR